MAAFGLRIDLDLSQLARPSSCCIHRALHALSSYNPSPTGPATGRHGWEQHADARTAFRGTWARRSIWSQSFDARNRRLLLRSPGGSLSWQSAW